MKTSFEMTEKCMMKPCISGFLRLLRHKTTCRACLIFKNLPVFLTRLNIEISSTAKVGPTRPIFAVLGPLMNTNFSAKLLGFSTAKKLSSYGNCARHASAHHCFTNQTEVDRVALRDPRMTSTGLERALALTLPSFYSPSVAC